MFLYTKFHANRTIFGEVITFQDGGRRGHATSLFAILDHTRSRRCGPNLQFKFDFGILITFGCIAILIFCHFACKMPNHVHFLVNFGGSYPQNLTLIILTPKGTSFGENASFEPSTVKIHPGVRPGRVPEKKSQNRTGQDNQQKGALA